MAPAADAGAATADDGNPDDDGSPPAKRPEQPDRTEQAEDAEDAA
jgi:hypothetical protein